MSRSHVVHTRPRSASARRVRPRSGDKSEALLLDADLRQALVLVRSIGRCGGRAQALVSSGYAPVVASRFLDARHVAHDTADEAVSHALRVLRRHPARVVHPLHDGTIEAVRARRAELAEHASVALAPETALAVAVDKTATLGLAARLGVPVPRGINVHRADDVDAAVAELGLPVVVKPSRSWLAVNGVGSRLVPVSARDAAEARLAVARIVAAGGTAIVQEWLSGRREAVSLVRAEGDVRAVFAQVTYRMAPSLGGSSVLRESIAPPPDVLDAAEALTAEIDLEGYSETEFRRDREGRAVLMEINPRLSASVELAVRAGLDLPLLHHLWAAREPLPRRAAYRVGVRMRWLGGDVSRLAESVRRRGRLDVPSPARALRDLIEGSIGRVSHDYLVFDDPAPALRAVGGWAARAADCAWRAASRPE